MFADDLERHVADPPAAADVEAEEARAAVDQVLHGRVVQTRKHLHQNYLQMRAGAGQRGHARVGDLSGARKRQRKKIKNKNTK